MDTVAFSRCAVDETARWPMEQVIEGDRDNGKRAQPLKVRAKELPFHSRGFAEQSRVVRLRSRLHQRILDTPRDGIPVEAFTPFRRGRLQERCTILYRFV